MKSLSNILAPVILASFLFVVVGGIFGMKHMSDNMDQGCLFSFPAASICPLDSITQAIHHISAYSSFFSIPLSQFMLLVLALLFALVFVYFFALRASPPEYAFAVFDPSPRLKFKDKLASWLALLEHSPSL